MNGRFNIDFPVTVQGKIDNQLSTDLGAGGPPIRVRTHNGGVKVIEEVNVAQDGPSSTALNSARSVPNG